MLIRLPLVAAVSAACLMLAACQKASETVAEKAIEKSLEAQMKQGGAKDAKVDLSSGQIKTTTVDKDGKTQTFEMGNAASVTEADVGLPFYPGGQLDDRHAVKVVSDREMAVSVAMETKDAPDKVVAFYRDHLKAKSAGKQFTDMNQGDGNHLLMLNDEAAHETLQVMVSAGKDGAPSTVMLNSSRKKG